jgi:hypothetical protein
VVEMDVCQRQHARLPELERRQQPRQAAARSGVDDHIAQAPGADHTRTAQVQQVDELSVGKDTFDRCK